MKKALQFIAFLSIGVAILGWVFKSQNAAFHEQCRLDGIPDQQCSLVDKLLHDFGTVNYWWLLAVVVAFTLSNIFRARRWQMLLEPLGYRDTHFSNALMTVFLSYFANLALPRMGEVVRAASFSKYEKLPLERVAGTCVVDRTMDFVCLLVVVALAFVFEGPTLLAFANQYRSGGAGQSIWQNPLVLITLGLLVVGAAALFFFWEIITELAVVQKIGKMAKGFLDGLRSVFRLENTPLFLVYSAGIWVMFFLQCLFSLWAFPPTAGLGWGQALMVFVIGTLGFVVPSPGGMGTFHLLSIAGLALYGVSGSDAFSYANISFFTIQIFYNFLAGGASLVLLPIWNRRRAAV